MQYKFTVLTSPLPDCYDLEVGTPVLKVASSHVQQGGYETDTWQRLDNGYKVDVRVEHRPCFTDIDIDGQNMSEIRAKMVAACDGFRGRA